MAALFSAADVPRLDRSYASPEIVEQRARTLAALCPRPGERGLEIGCGPGLLLPDLARGVGRQGRIAAIDESPDMVAAARERIGREGVAERVAVAVGDAVRLEFPPESFDFVVGVQVYLYVAEIEGALAEAARVLVRGGRLVVVDTDWDSCVWRSSDRARTRRIVEARMAHFAQPHLPPELPRLLREAGLTPRQAGVIPILNLAYDPDSFSGSLIGSTRAIAIRHGVPSEEAEAWEADLLARTGEGEYFFSVNRYLFVAEKP